MQSIGERTCSDSRNSRLGRPVGGETMIRTMENTRKLVFGRIGLLLVGSGLAFSAMSLALIGIVITTLFTVDIVLTLREESV